MGHIASTDDWQETGNVLLQFDAIGAINLAHPVLAKETKDSKTFREHSAYCEASFYLIPRSATRYSGLSPDSSKHVGSTAHSSAQLSRIT